MSEQTSEEKRNLDVLRRLFAAFEAGDIDTMTKIYSSDVHYHTPKLALFKTDYHGVPDLMGMFGTVAHETGGTFRANVQAIAASGNRGFVLYRATGTRGGKTLNTNDVLVVTLADGSVTEAYFCHGDFPATAAFWS
jgi:ketosteroid isomerase-like protein